MFRLEDLGPPTSHQEKVASVKKWFESLRDSAARSLTGEDMHRRTDEDVARLEAIEEARVLEAERAERARALAEEIAKDEEMSSRREDIYKRVSELQAANAAELKSLQEQEAAAKAEAARIEAARQEAAKAEAARQEAAKAKAARQEAAKAEAERAEAARAEAARAEAERAEAARQEAAKSQDNKAQTTKSSPDKKLKEDTIPASAYTRPKSLLNNPYVQGGIGLAGTAGLLYALDSATRD